MEKVKKANDVLSNFVNVMEQNFSKEDLANMYNNLLTLRIVLKKDNFLDNYLSLYFLGLYFYKQNKIKLYTEDFESVLYHELLHMSSCSSKKRVPFKGLDEAYTQYMTNRYFNDDLLDYTVLFVEYLDKIVGHDILSKIYLNDNFSDVVNNLSEYAKKEEILNFLKNMDILYEMRDYDIKDIRKYNKSIFDFLITIYARKEFKLCKENNSTKDICYYKIIAFIEELKRKLYQLEEFRKSKITLYRGKYE